MAQAVALVPPLPLLLAVAATAALPAFASVTPLMLLSALPVSSSDRTLVWLLRASATIE